MSRSHCSIDHHRAGSEVNTHQSKSHQKLKSEKYFQIYSNMLHPDRLMTSESSTGLIGPGHYNYNSSSFGGPFCTFSSTQRFTFTYSGLSSPVTHFPLNFQAKNMDLERFTPQNKKDLLRIKALNEQNRISKALKTKNKLDKDKKKDKLKKMQEKHNKFRMKIQFIEVKRCSNTWMTLMAFTTFTTSAYFQLVYLKDLKRRSEKLRKFLRIFSRFLGKMKTLLKKKKVAKALSVLTRFAVVVKRWVRVKRSKYLGIMNHVVYQAAAKEKIFRFMYQWRVSLTFIQRIWKKMNIEKKVAMALRLMYWEKHEKSLFESQISIRNGSRPKFQSYTPQSIKEKLIKDLLKRRIREYYKKCLKFRENIKNEFIKQKNDNLKVPGGKRNNISMAVEKPQPNYNFTKKDYLKMIKQASLIRKNSKMLNKIPTLR